MTLAIILVIAAALGLALLLWTTFSRSLSISGDASLAGQIQPIDIAAFRNLVDPAEDAYLRRRLPASELRVVRRERLRAMLVYVQTAGRNAAVLTSMAQNALASTDAETVEAARQLVSNAALLRSNATVALFRIRVAMVWPTSGVAHAPVLLGYERTYEQLSGSAMLLGRLKNPAAPVRIAAS